MRIYLKRVQMRTHPQTQKHKTKKPSRAKNPELSATANHTLPDVKKTVKKNLQNNMYTTPTVVIPTTITKEFTTVRGYEHTLEEAINTNRATTDTINPNLIHKTPDTYTNPQSPDTKNHTPLNDILVAIDHTDRTPLDDHNHILPNGKNGQLAKIDHTHSSLPDNTQHPSPYHHVLSNEPPNGFLPEHETDTMAPSNPAPHTTQHQPDHFSPSIYQALTYTTYWCPITQTAITSPTTIDITPTTSPISLFPDTRNTNAYYITLNNRILHPYQLLSSITSLAPNDPLPTLTLRPRLRGGTPPDNPNNTPHPNPRYRGPQGPVTRHSCRHPILKDSSPLFPPTHHFFTIALPIYDGHGFIWDEVEVKSTLDGRGNGLYAKKDLPPGITIPIIGHISPKWPAHSSSHGWVLYTNKKPIPPGYTHKTRYLLDGHPSINPYNDIPVFGLCPTMMANEPPRQGPTNIANLPANCVFLNDCLVTLFPIEIGSELTVFYGSGYTRQGYSLDNVADGYATPTSPYHNYWEYNTTFPTGAAANHPQVYRHIFSLLETSQEMYNDPLSRA